MIYGGFNAEPEVWQHLVDYVLPTAIPNTLWLVAGVTTLAILIGTLLAWLTTAYAFAGRRLFVILLLLPLAMPSYILAFIYLDWIRTLHLCQRGGGHRVGASFRYNLGEH